MNKCFTLIVMIYCFLCWIFFELLVIVLRWNLFSGFIFLHTKEANPPKPPPSSQATRSHLWKAKSYEPKVQNETMLPIKRENASLFHTSSIGRHQSPPTFQPKKKNRGVRKKRPTPGSREKKKQWESWKKAKRKLNKLN